MAISYLPNLMNFKAFPKSHWKRIRTTNGIERINKELKRRSRVVGAFPNSDSLLRLAVSILIDVNEDWITGRRYYYLWMRNDHVWIQGTCKLQTIRYATTY